MGNIFSLGFGPFRWVCTSCDPHDLRHTDEIALQVMKAQLATANPHSEKQLLDNIKWIEEAEKSQLVVGSQARILYADAQGRAAIASAMNSAVRDGHLKGVLCVYLFVCVCAHLLSGPVVISRDHHDVSGTDAPYRETANITDGSVYTADMAVHNFVGDAFRGATWVALHNGGGTGWGVAVNGGHGHVLDGSLEAEQRAREMLFWDVNNGVNRRAWAGSCRMFCFFFFLPFLLPHSLTGNANAQLAIKEAMAVNPGLRVTLAHSADSHLVKHSLASHK